jgi:hypothetical protein
MKQLIASIPVLHRYARQAKRIGRLMTGKDAL